jgi:hypothetical protein
MTFYGSVNKIIDAVSFLFNLNAENLIILYSIMSVMITLDYVEFTHSNIYKTQSYVSVFIYTN